MKASSIAALACAGLALSLSAPALGQTGGNPSPSFDSSLAIRMKRVPIPANGALIIESPTMGMPTLEVTSQWTEPVPGQATWVGGSARGALFAWRPSSGFLEPGVYVAVLYYDIRSSDRWTQSFTVVEAIDDAPPVITAEPSISNAMSPNATTCCSDPLGNSVEHCAPDELFSTLELHGGLSSTESGVKLNQYLFALSDSESRVLFDPPFFVPFEELSYLGFDVAVSAYCFSVDAVNVTTLEVHHYEDIERCAEPGDVVIGPIDSPPGPEFFDRSVCTVPDAKHVGTWCEVNDDACIERKSGDCELYAHVCEGAPLPSAWTMTARQPKGCTVASRRSTLPAVMWLALALAMRARRRRRRLAR